MIRRISIFTLLSTLALLGPLGALGAGCAPPLMDAPGTDGGGGTTGGMVACGGASGTNGLATWANIRDIIETGLPVGCFGSDCHRQGEREPVLLSVTGQLSDAALYEKLTTYKTEKCGKRMLVKPCAPEESAFYVAQKGTCGDVPQMPFGCLPEFDNCTPADKLEGVRQWILNGAPRP